MERGNKLWFVDGHTGKIDKITITSTNKTKKQFSFVSHRRVYKADFSTVGVKYFETRDALMDSLKHRAALRTREVKNEQDR